MSRAARPLLLPLVPVYRLGLALSTLNREPVRRLSHPVISIGNLSTGGSGKTPLTIALARALTAKGFQVDVLSRGYGREGSQPARVHLEGTASQFGDEPLLIAREAGVPVFVAPRRYDAGLLAEGAAPPETGKLDLTVHMLDDGFQHRRLWRAVDILLLNRTDWEDRLLPAGNLREPLSALHRASVLAIPDEDHTLASDLRSFGWQGPIWRIRRIMEPPRVDGPVLAFCGVARPDQFFAGLESAGIKIAYRLAFRDHFRYRSTDLDHIFETAQSLSVSALVSTEKDLIRLGSLAATLPAGLSLRTARLAVEIENESVAVDWLIAQLRAQGTAAAL